MTPDDYPDGFEIIVAVRPTARRGDPRREPVAVEVAAWAETLTEAQHLRRELVRLADLEGMAQPALFA